MTGASNTGTRKRLKGWREIAAHLGRSESTVKRWSVQHELPVYRPRGVKSRRGLPVYAFSDELDVWMFGNATFDVLNETTPETADTIPEVIEVTPLAETSSLNAAARKGRFDRRVIAASLLGLVLAAGAGAAIWWQGSGQSVAEVTVAENVPADARELYLRGTYLWNRRTPEGIAEAIPTFHQALAIHPDYADAHAGLAMTYNLARQYSGMSGFEAYPLAEAAARRAVELQPDNAFAQSVLAFVEFHWLWNVDAGLARFEESLRLDPNAANTWMWYASSLMHVMRHDDALTAIRRAQTLDPDSTTILNIKAQALFFSGDEEAGMSLLRDLIARDPGHPWNYETKASFLMAQGDYERALEYSARVADMIGVPRQRIVAEAGLEALRSGGSEAMIAAMVATDTEFFERGEALAWDVARHYAVLGKTDEALHWLHISRDRHEERLIGVAMHAAFRPLRNAPEYRQFVAHVGLPVSL